MSYELWVIFDAFFFILLLLPFLSLIRIRKRTLFFLQTRKYTNILLIGCLIFCIYNKTEGDYFHYETFLKDIVTFKLTDTFETPYMYLISIIGNNYFLFRLFIWGAALLIYKRILQIVKLDYDLTISLFILFTLIAFAYARISLALAIFFWGATIINVNIEARSYFKSITGFCLIALSLLFHKSMFFPCLLFLFLLCLKMNRRRMLLLLFLFPLAVYFMNNHLENILLMESGVSEMNRGLGYLATKKTPLGLSMSVSLILSIPSMMLLLFVMAKDFYKKKTTEVPLSIIKLFEMCVFFILISFLILFIDSGGRYLYVRIKEMSYIPFSIVLSYYFIHFRIKKRIFVTSLIFILLLDTFYFGYAYYLKSIGDGL